MSLGKGKLCPLKAVSRWDMTIISYGTDFTGGTGQYLFGVTAGRNGICSVSRRDGTEFVRCHGGMRRIFSTGEMLWAGADGMCRRSGKLSAGRDRSGRRDRFDGGLAVRSRSVPPLPPLPSRRNAVISLVFVYVSWTAVQHRWRVPVISALLGLRIASPPSPGPRLIDYDSYWKLRGKGRTSCMVDVYFAWDATTLFMDYYFASKRNHAFQARREAW